MDSNRKRPPAPSDSTEEITHHTSTPQTLTHPISPPTKKRRLPDQETAQAAEEPTKTTSACPPQRHQQTFKSPFQLTTIRGLPEELNRDTVSLKDLLGDPLISECWEFNYLHDIDFLMGSFDVDVRALVKVHVVHGFWKKEDPHRTGYEADAARYPNVAVHAVYLPEMFGTHHSKMLILLRHDDTAQVVIHTANMIPRDWGNMTQAVWASPRLPLLKPSPRPAGGTDPDSPTGSGEKFKIDLLNYLRAYDRHRRTCKPIIDQLARYDFSAVRGALIASVPGRFPVSDGPPTTTKWGWAAMQEALRAVSVRPGKAEIAIQISSIATLGPTDSWLRSTFFPALSGGRGSSVGGPDFKVVFPTPDEIRKSLDGYASGGSIHTKIQSGQQTKQLQYLRPLFCHWANDSAGGAELPGDAVIRDAGRKRAAPHIKTYIRYANKSHDTIDWALVTSANLSKQAWGDAKSSAGEMRVSSYEIGVMVWPELFAEDAVMTAAFLGDTVGEEDEHRETPVVSLRMPYSLPLQAYGKQEVPWVATASHTEPDWMGRIWRDG